MRTITLEQFQGPLDLLLTLIERERLDISTVSLSRVTEQYLGFLAQTEEMDPEELADFLVVAAKLLVLKSRALLPMLTGDEEDGDDLAKQLRIYKEYYDAAQGIARLLHKHRFTYGRETAIRIEPKFSPPTRLTADALRISFLNVLHQLEPLALFRNEETIARTVSLREKIASIHKLLTEGAAVDFHSLLEQAETRMDVIVTFLALLELVKQRRIIVRQQDMFSHIHIEQHRPESI